MNTIPYKRVTKVTSKGVGLQLQSLLAMKSIYKVISFSFPGPGAAIIPPLPRWEWLSKRADSLLEPMSKSIVLSGGKINTAESLFWFGLTTRCSSSSTKDEKLLNWYASPHFTTPEKPSCGWLMMSGALYVTCWLPSKL